MARHGKIPLLTRHLRVRIAPRPTQEIILVSALQHGEGKIRTERWDIKTREGFTQLGRVPLAARVAPLLLQGLVGFLLQVTGLNIGPIRLIKREEQEQHADGEHKLTNDGAHRCLSARCGLWHGSYTSPCTV